MRKGVSPANNIESARYIESYLFATGQLEAEEAVTQLSDEPTETEETIVAPPQASARTVPAAPQTRGVAGLTEPAGAGDLPTPVTAPPPQAVAQGPSQSREMMDRLFPMDMV